MRTLLLSLFVSSLSILMLIAAGILVLAPRIRSLLPLWSYGVFGFLGGAILILSIVTPILHYQDFRHQQSKERKETKEKPRV